MVEGCYDQGCGRGLQDHDSKNGWVLKSFYGKGRLLDADFIVPDSRGNMGKWARSGIATGSWHHAGRTATLSFLRALFDLYMFCYFCLGPYFLNASLPLEVPFKRILSTLRTLLKLLAHQSLVCVSWRSHV